MAPVPLLDLQLQFAPLRKDILRAVEEVFDSQKFILGDPVKALEEEVAAYSNARHGVGVSSGTDAILICLMAENIGPGDEVITTPYSFFATAGCISRVGATPVFVDIDPVTFNMDADLLEAAITPKTKAVMPIHLFGQMAYLEPIMDLAARHDLAVIEDAAQAIGAEYQNRRAGSIGHYGCFSFFPSKNLGAAGDGGMVVTNDDERADLLRIHRGHGARPKYYHKLIGGNFRLDAIQAAVLRVKMPHLESWTLGRQRNADTYRRLFQEVDLISDLQPECLMGGCKSFPSCEMSSQRGVVLPAETNGFRHIYNQFVIRVHERDRLLEFLAGKGIGTAIYYPVPFHLQECFSPLGYQVGDFPASECAAKHSLALPIFPELEEEQINSVVSAIGEFLNRS